MLKILKKDKKSNKHATMGFEPNLLKHLKITLMIGCSQWSRIQLSYQALLGSDGTY